MTKTGLPLNLSAPIATDTPKWVSDFTENMVKINSFAATKGKASGLASLDSMGKLEQMPTAQDTGAAPQNHASTSTTYGVASTTNYGHVKFGTTSSTACVGNDPRLTPIGAIMPYSGSSAPTGYLLCQGQAVSRTTYSALYNVIGITYGSGDGSTTFNFPDLRAKTAVGYKSGDSDFGTLGKETGEKAAGLVAHIGAFNGGLNSIGYSTIPVEQVSGVDFYEGAGVKDTAWANQSKTPTFVTKVTDYSGQNPSHIQPSLTINYIIKY